MYEYKAEITKVYDGDTLTADIDLGFGIWMKKQKLRMYGIDTPEIRTKDAAEKVAGYAARDALRMKLLATGNEVTLRTYKRPKGKYGRWLAIVYIDDVCLNDWMVHQGFAVEYMVGEG